MDEKLYQWNTLCSVSSLTEPVYQPDTGVGPFTSLRVILHHDSTAAVSRTTGSLSNV